MTNQKGQQLIALLQREIDYINQLINTLFEEKEALGKRDFVFMQELALKKEHFSNLLEESAKNKILLLDSSQINQKEALEAFLIHLNQEDAVFIRQLNNELASKITACRELNIINGQVITSNLNTRRELVDILTGKDSKAAINTYSATGSLKTHSESINHQEA